MNDPNAVDNRHRPVEECDEVILTLTLSGNRAKLSALLAQMALMDGYCVIEGSFSSQRTELS